MDIEKLAHDVQEAAANTKFEKYLLSDEPVRNREEREDVLLQRRLDEDTKKSREVAVKNQQQLQVEYNRINRNIDLQFATLLAQTHSGLKVPRPQMEGLHGVGGNGGRPLVGPQVLTSAVLDENAAGGILSHASGYMSGDIRSPGLTTKKSVEKSRNKPREESTRADLRPTGSTYFSARPQQNVSTTAGRALPGPPPPSHRSGPSVFSSQSVSNYAIAFPVPFEESGFTSVIRWADIAYEEAVVAALGPGADFIALRQKEMPSRVLVTVTCYVLNEILSRDSHLRDVWHKLRTPLFDAVYSPQMVGVQMVKRGETALQQKKSGAKEKSIRKIFLQSDEEMEEEKRGKCGYLESIPASSTACGWNGSSGTMEERNGVTQPYERENMESFPDSRESKKNKEEEEYGVVPSFPARYVQYTNQHDYASYCLWTEEMLQVKRLNNALAKRVSELKEVVQKSRLVLDLAGRRVDRYRKQFIFCAWRSYVASMGRCRRTATNYIIRQKNNRLVESCFLKWRRVPLQEKVDHLESQVGELKRKLQMSNEIHQSEMNALRAKGKVAQDKLQDLTLKDEALRNQMLESHRLETTGLQSALTKSTKKAIQLREHSRRWERLAKTSRPMLLCRSVPKPLLSTAIDLCALEEEIFSHPISGWGSLAEAHPSFARQAVPLLEQLLCHWVNFIMQGSPSHKSWVPVVGCAKKLNASSPPALLQRSNGPDSGRGPGSARGHTGFASRPQTFRGQVEGGERASTALDNRVGSRSRSSFSYPTMNQMASSSPGSKSALCAALLGPLPDALESGQLSPLGLLMVVRELRRLLPIEVMDLERELGQANTVAGGEGGSTTPFSRTMANYVGSLENKSNRKSFTSHSTIGGGLDDFFTEGGDDRRRHGNDLLVTEEEKHGCNPSLDHSTHSIRTAASSSGVPSVPGSPHSSTPPGSVKKSYFPHRYRRSTSRRRHPRQLVVLAPPSPFALYQELTALLHEYSAEGLVPSLLQQCPYLDAFYTPQGLAYMANPCFYVWVLAALFTGYVQKMVLMENASSTSSATPSGVSHYLRHSKVEQHIAKKAHPAVTGTIAAEIANIPPALLEELQVASSAPTSGSGTARRRSASSLRMRRPSVRSTSASGKENESGAGNVSGGAYILAKQTTVGKRPPSVAPSTLSTPRNRRVDAYTGEREDTRSAAEVPGVDFPDAGSLLDSPAAAMASSSPSPLMFTSSSLTCYPAYGSGAGIVVRGGAANGTTTPSATSLPVRNGRPESTRVFTGPFRVTNFSEVPTVREGIDVASDISVYVGCQVEDLPDSDDDQYDVQEVVMEMVKEEEHLFALQREIRRLSIEDGEPLSDVGEADGSEADMEMPAEEVEIARTLREEKEEERRHTARVAAEGKERMARRASATGGTEPPKGKGQSGGRSTGEAEKRNASSTVYANGKTKLAKANRVATSSDLRTRKEKKKAKSHGNGHTATRAGNAQRRDSSLDRQQGGRAGSAPATLREISGAGAWFPRLSMSSMGAEASMSPPPFMESMPFLTENKDVDAYGDGTGEGAFFYSAKDSSGWTAIGKGTRTQKPLRFKSVAFEDGGIAKGTRRWVGGDEKEWASTTMMGPDVPSIPPFFWENDDRTREDIPEVRKVVQALENQMAREKKRDRMQSAAFFLDPKEDLLAVEQVQFLHLLPRPSKAFNVVLHRDQALLLKKRATERRSLAASSRRRRPSHQSENDSMGIGEGGKEEERPPRRRSTLDRRRPPGGGGAHLSTSASVAALHAKANGARARKNGGVLAKGKGKTTGSRKSGSGVDLENSAIAKGSLPASGGANRSSSHASAPSRPTGDHSRRSSSAREPHRRGGGEGLSERVGKSGAPEKGETGSIGDGEGEEDSDEDADEGAIEEAQELDVVPHFLRRNLERLAVHTFAKRLVRDQIHRQEWLGVARIVVSFLVRIRLLDVGPGVPDRSTASRLRVAHGSGRDHGGGADHLRMDGTGSFPSRYERLNFGNGSPSSQDESSHPRTASKGPTALSMRIHALSPEDGGVGDSRMDAISVQSGRSVDIGAHERRRASEVGVPILVPPFVPAVVGEGGGGGRRTSSGQERNGSVHVAPSGGTPQWTGEEREGMRHAEVKEGDSRTPREPLPSPSPPPPLLVPLNPIVVSPSPNTHGASTASSVPSHRFAHDAGSDGVLGTHRTAPGVEPSSHALCIDPPPSSPLTPSHGVSASRHASSSTVLPLERPQPSAGLPLSSSMTSAKDGPAHHEQFPSMRRGSAFHARHTKDDDPHEGGQNEVEETTHDAKREREKPAVQGSYSIEHSSLSSSPGFDTEGGPPTSSDGTGTIPHASGPSPPLWHTERRRTADHVVSSHDESLSKGIERREAGLPEERQESEKPSSSHPSSSSSTSLVPFWMRAGGQRASSTRSTTREEKDKKRGSRSPLSSPLLGSDRGEKKIHENDFGAFVFSDLETRQQGSDGVMEKQRNTQLGHAYITPPPTAAMRIDGERASLLESLRVSSGRMASSPRVGSGDFQEQGRRSPSVGHPRYSEVQRKVSFSPPFIPPIASGSVDTSGSNDLKTVKGHHMRHAGREHMQEVTPVPLSSSSFPSSTALIPQSLNPLRVPPPGQHMGPVGALYPFSSERRRRQWNPGSNSLRLNVAEGMSRGIISSASRSPDLMRMAVSKGRKITAAQHALDAVIIHQPAHVPPHSSVLPKDRFDIRKE